MIMRDSRDAMDVVAATVSAGVVAKVVPTVVGILTIIWFCIRIFEWARVAIFKYPPREPFRK